MNTSIFLAQLIGPLMALIGIAVIVNGRAFARLAGDFLKSPALLFLSGFMLVPAGLAIVLVHNVWSGWPVVVTLIGWLTLISGAIRLAAPMQASGFARKIQSMRSYTIAAGALWAAVGLTLCYFGYR